MRALLAQIASGNKSVIGAMVESNLEAGSQPFPSAGGLRYGVSITDACIDWDSTESLVREIRAAVGHRFR
jgi:3-deoxy-7-phosphoheptulonate synthase